MRTLVTAIVVRGCAMVVLALLALGACSQAPDKSGQGGQSGAKLPVVVEPVAPVDDGPPVRLFASKFASKIRLAPDKDARRIGYMRGGAVLMAKTSKPLGFEACRKGWFELETGGFVCSTTDVIAFTGKRYPERRPTQPSFETRLPYPYGYSRSKNTPVYRRLPTDDEAATFEGYKIPGSDPAAVGGGIDAAPPEPIATPVADPSAASAPTTPAQPIAPDVSPAVAAAAAAEAARTQQNVAGEPADAGGVPTLASLMGDQSGVLMRRMERGFYVSLDREISKGIRSYWQTQSTGFIPKSRLGLVDGSEFHGLELATPEAPDAPQLPVGFLLSKSVEAHTLDAKGRLHNAGQPGYHYAFGIKSETDVHGKHYVVANDDKLFAPSKDVVVIRARDKPSEVADDERWIDIDLGAQSLVAYIGSKPIYVTLISSGRIKDELDPLRNFVTPTGSFRITSKHLTATMDGDHALDGPYSIEDVPYVMYFQLAYALHCAFWHNSFGRPHSHGCINLAPADAKWLFFWATPKLPTSWHGIYPSDADPGTRVIIHGETPKG